MNTSHVVKKIKPWMSAFLECMSEHREFILLTVARDTCKKKGQLSLFPTVDKHDKPIKALYRRNYGKHGKEAWMRVG